MQCRTDCLAGWCELRQAVRLPQLMQGGLARGALLSPTQGPKGEVTPILGSQHPGGLAPLPHAQRYAGPCTGNITVAQQLSPTSHCCQQPDSVTACMYVRMHDAASANTYVVSTRCAHQHAGVALQPSC